jgi:hypothetical protein
MSFGNTRPVGGREGDQVIRLGSRKGWGAEALCPAPIGTVEVLRIRIYVMAASGRIQYDYKQTNKRPVGKGRPFLVTCLHHSANSEKADFWYIRRQQQD